VRTMEITNEQYNQGAIDFTAVFVFQENLTEQQDQLAVAQGDIALSLISVYRALGGGWQIRLGRNFSDVPESEIDVPESGVLEQPLFEEMPLPEADNDIQFQSLAVQRSILKSADAEGDLQAKPPIAIELPIVMNLPTSSEGESS
jgi:hypothetical protein